MEKMEEWNNDKILSLDLGLEVLSWLPAKSVLRFRSVCKAWNAGTRDHHFAELHLARSCNYDNNKEKTTFLFLTSKIAGKSSWFANGNPRRTRMHFHGSCNGLLCLSRVATYSNIYLYNPTTQEYLRLPSFGKSFLCHKVIGFGYDSLNKEYKVLCFGHSRLPDRSEQADLLVCAVPVVQGHPKPWRLIGSSPDTTGIEAAGTGILINGRLHWLLATSGKVAWMAGDSYFEIKSLDLHDEQIRNISMERTGWSLEEEVMHGLLLELDGCLALQVAYSRHKMIKIWIMKEYEDCESWQLIFFFSMKGLPVSWYYPEIPCRCLLKDGLLLFCSGRRIISYSRRTNEVDIQVEVNVSDNNNSQLCWATILPFVNSLVSFKGASPPNRTAAPSGVALCFDVCWKRP